MVHVTSGLRHGVLPLRRKKILSGHTTPLSVKGPTALTSGTKAKAPTMCGYVRSIFSTNKGL